MLFGFSYLVYHVVLGATPPIRNLVTEETRPVVEKCFVFPLVLQHQH